jgi:hypothetical protein
MCLQPIEEGHGQASHSHVADLEQRSLMCTCRPCALLFVSGGAGGGRYRAVPERYYYAPSSVLSAAHWEQLQIPVSVAFFFNNTAQGQWVACYPSPAGATESLLPMDTWTEVLADNPAFGDAEPDVEAVLIRRQGGEGEGPEVSTEGYLVPIDACYQLVGLVRLHWRGFDGGEEAWQHIDKFFDGLRSRAKVVPSGNAHG